MLYGFFPLFFNQCAVQFSDWYVKPTLHSFDKAIYIGCIILNVCGCI